MSVALHQTVLERVRAEYLEMPGMKLRPEQVQRLCGVDQSICAAVLDSLVEMKFLCIKTDGAYARLTDGEIPHLRSAKAVLIPNGRERSPTSTATNASRLRNVPDRHSGDSVDCEHSMVGVSCADSRSAVRSRVRLDANEAGCDSSRRG